MVGLKKARLNKGNTNTLFDAYSEEEYEYDLAGNPYRYRVGSSAWNAVSSNKNNQTTQIDYASDAVLPIRGKASTSATLNISVDGALQNYTRPSGQENFAFGLNAYTSTRKYQEVKAEAVETDNNTTPPTTIRTMQRGKAYVEATPESFTYDANGNLLSDGRWNYTWDAENRLIEVETNLSAASAGVKQEKYVYVYDWTGRKIKAERYEYEDNAWVLVSTNKRYYDDYNLIYETTEYADGSSTEVRKYYYGTDLLGSVYGSAGTGGLRMMSINGEDLFMFNNQVGSVEALYGADAATAAQARAEYLYSAYGEVMMKSGDLADKNNITYSTRYQEANTGLVSYTYRHYSPRLKKWLSKDPIAENGGINLYGMVGNDPVGNWDMLGMKLYSKKLVLSVKMGGTVFKTPTLIDLAKDAAAAKIKKLIVAEIKKAKVFNKKPDIIKIFLIAPTLARFMNSAGFTITDAYAEAEAECKDECYVSKGIVSSKSKTNTTFLAPIHPLDLQSVEKGISDTLYQIKNLVDDVYKNMEKECNEKK